MIPWHYPITPVPQLDSWSCLWDVVLVVTTDILSRKGNFFGSRWRSGKLECWWAAPWGQVGVMDEGELKRNIRHFCHCKERHDEQTRATACCDTTATCHSGNHFCHKCEPDCTLSQHSWSLFQMVQLSPILVAHGVERTEICFSHTLFSLLPCPPCLF